MAVASRPWQHEWRRLWEDGAWVVAWSWLRTPVGTLDLDVHHPGHRDLPDDENRVAACAPYRARGFETHGRLVGCGR
jgi:hypothetical protein